jgi:hypothetical protein
MILMRGKKDYETLLSYRPISLLPYIGKIMEIIMAKHISKYTTITKKVSNTQLGKISLI